MRRSTKTVFLTDGTSTIGRDAAIVLADAGFRVVAGGMPAAELHNLKWWHRGIELIELDVDDAGSVARCAEDLAGMTGGRGVDVLINSSECTPAERFTPTAAESFGAFHAPALLATARAVTSKMRARGAGLVLNLSRGPRRAVCSADAGVATAMRRVEALSDSLRAELSGAGIDVVLIRAIVRERPASKLARRPAGDSATHTTARAILRVVQARKPRQRYLIPGPMQRMLWTFIDLPQRLSHGLRNALARSSPARSAR
jgi:NAD(P)-dependent dehydrogenase (short-subunit alcohol dehydrogenase family)